MFFKLKMYDLKQQNLLVTCRLMSTLEAMLKVLTWAIISKGKKCFIKMFFFKIKVGQLFCLQ